MSESKVSLLTTRFGRCRFPEVGRFSQVVGHQLVLERLVRGFREHRFFFEDRQDTHGLDLRTNRYTELDECVKLCFVADPSALKNICSQPLNSLAAHFVTNEFNEKRFF